VKVGDQFIASASFLVADYQPPAFESNLGVPSEVVRRSPLESSVWAAYYFGQQWQCRGALASQRPAIRVRVAGDPTFRFGDADQQTTRVTARPANAARAEGAGRTARDGVFGFQVRPT